MSLKQISVFLENKKGRLAEVTDILGKNGINIKAMSLADTSDFGVLRLIVNDPDRCVTILKSSGFVAQETDVIGIEVEDKPGGLFRVLDILEKNSINVEYMYATVEKNKNFAIVIFKVDVKERAMKILSDNKISIASNSDIS